MKEQMGEIERRWSTKYETELARIRTEYEIKINEISQVKGNELQSKILMLER